MSRRLAALALVACTTALPAAAQTVSIVVEGDVRITIEQPGPEQTKPTQPRPNKDPNGGAPNKPGHWMQPGGPIDRHTPPAVHTPQGMGDGQRGPNVQEMNDRTANGAEDRDHPTQGFQHVQPHNPAHGTPGALGRAQEGGKPLVDGQRPVVPKPGPSTCDAKALDVLVGGTLPKGAALLDLDLGTKVRILTEGQPYTLDKRLDRATIVVDTQRIVQDAYCG